MKISILLITYNHSAYIAQCLEGIAIQQISNEIEIIVADDFSTDDTLDSILNFLFTYKSKHLILPSQQNVGFVKNYQRGFKACTGDYIAVIEGDDYWTDPLRLRKHVDFLQMHRECVMSMNRIIYLNTEQLLFTVADWEEAEEFYYVSTSQMARGNKLGNMSACMFRKAEIDKLSPALFDLIVADWMIGMALSQYGFIAILKEAMSVYRIHNKGLFSSMENDKQISHLLELTDIYDAYFKYKYHNDFAVFKDSLQQNKRAEKAITYFKKDFVSTIILKAFKLLLPPALIKWIKGKRRKI